MKSEAQATFTDCSAVIDGLSAGDCLCQEHADAAGLSGTFKAYLTFGDNCGDDDDDGSSGISAIDRVIECRFEWHLVGNPNPTGIDWAITLYIIALLSICYMILKLVS